MHSFSCIYVQLLQVYKAFTQSVQGQCTKCTRVYKGVYLKGFQVILKNLLIYFFPIVEEILLTYCLNGDSLHAFYLMSTMLIKLI